MKIYLPNLNRKKQHALLILTFLLFSFMTSLNAQVSIISTSPVTEAFTGFAGGAPPTNWDIKGTGARGTLWNGTTQTTGTNGGWYGNANISFLGSGTATNGNATWILQNNTGYTITQFTLSFIATRWKTGTASPTVTVTYSNSASSTVPAQGALANALSSLTFSDVTPNIATGASLTQTASSINIPNGDYVYIRFIHAGGNNSDNLGWDDVIFTPVVPQVNIAAVSPAAGNIYPNTTNNILQSFSINPIFTGLTVSDLTVNTGGTYALTDIQSTPFKLYINSTNNLSGATQIGTAQSAVASGGMVSFTGLASTISSGATRYLIVTVDLSGIAITNNNINIAATPFTNINFSAVPVKNGTNPVPASALQNIFYGASFAATGLPAAGNIGQSSTDNALFEFVITPLGGSASIDFTGVTITATGNVTASDMSNFKIINDVDASGDYSGGDIIVSGSVGFGSTMNFTIAGQTGLVADTRYLLIADVAALPAFGRFITASINANTDITITGNVISIAPYSGNTQTIVNTGVTSLASDYFRSTKVNGNWTTTSTWESSIDNATWHVATLIPGNGTTKGITIKNLTTVTIDSTTTVRLLTIDAGGTLKHTNGITFNINNLPAANTNPEFTINGTYVLNGTRPVMAANTNIVVNNAGVVRVDDNTGGQSDDFARRADVEFKTGSLFLWNTVLAFETDNITYFLGPNYAINKPIFRVSQAVSVGANTTTIFNGKFESTSSNPLFKNSGTKIFRDGLGGVGFSAKVTHTTGSGPFQITATDAVIDGNLILNIDNAPGTNDLQIISGATVTISGSPTINIGNSGASGSDMVVDGTLINNGSNPVLITYGNLYINGYINPSSTNSFMAGADASSTTLVSVGGTANTSAGALKLTAGSNYINTFIMNRGTSGPGGNLTMASSVNAKSLTLTRGELATDNNLVTWLNSGAGSTLTSPASALYSDSYICTCNSNGVEITPTGNNGFRINNVSGNTDQMFPIGTDFKSANRMALNMNNVTADNFTVVVGKGDIGNTPLPRVNRIWYVSEGTPGGSTATMKLYFTKRDWNTYSFGSAQNDEIEDGFLYADPHLVQENYSNFFVNVATTATADVPDYTASSYLSEIFGRYYLNVSSDYLGATNGINGFTRFSVVNAQGIILPVSVINLKAYQKNSGIQVDWSALNELNIDNYEVQRSGNGTSFTPIVKITARNNGASNSYTAFDPTPSAGNNFYRIKTLDKNGTVSYTNIVSVNIGAGKPGISVQPNPVQNRLANLQLTNLAAGNYSLMLYSSSGQPVYNKIIVYSGGSSAQLMLLPPYVKPGVYVLLVYNSSSNFSLRVVVQ